MYNKKKKKKLLMAFINKSLKVSLSSKAYVGPKEVFKINN